MQEREGVRRHFDYSNVMSTLAVFLVIAGGTALAAKKPIVQSSKDVAKQAIKNSDIKKENLRGNRFRNDAITGEKVEDGSLFAVDFAPDQLPAGPQGPQGPGGPQGERGPQGVPGQDGAQGPPGPTFGVTEGAATPPASPDGVNFFLTFVNFSIPTEGRLLVTSDVPLQVGGAPGVRVDCSSNFNPTVGLYIDGVPIPGTARTIGDNVPNPYAASAVTAPVAAGAHTVQGMADCPGASTPEGGSIGGNRSLSVILLGS
jgi:hypothetical protein